MCWRSRSCSSWVATVSLANLEGRTIGRIVPDPATVQRLLAAAAVSLEDAQIPGLNEVSRFDLAYRSIMQHATLALHACGYRTPTSKPGHHMTLIQTLSLTIGLDSATVLLLDALRKQRNGIDYHGDFVSQAMVDTCLAQAQALSSRVRSWLAETHPDLA